MKRFSSAFHAGPRWHRSWGWLFGATLLVAVIYYSGWTQAYDTLIENLWKAEIAPHHKLEPASTFLG